MSIRASALFEEFRRNGLLLAMTGEDAVIEGVGPVEDCSPGDLVFVDRKEFVEPALRGGPAAVITTGELAAAFATDAKLAVLTAPDVTLARALVTQRFFDRDLRPEGTPRVDPSAVIAETAEVAATARIGANVYVGPGAKVGEETVILANAVIEERAVVGDRTVIHPGVVVGFECRIGNEVIIGAGTVIGSEGFGFAQDKERRSHRIPQMGWVEIEDRVVIGSNCCLDRGTHAATRIGAGTIMDNLCHVAHNVETGEDCILTAMLCVAGSTRLGNRVITSGMTGILDHLTIADDVVLVQRAGVGNDVKQPGVYAGSPVMPLKEYMKNQAALRRISSMRDAIKQLEKRLAELESDSADA